MKNIFYLLLLFGSFVQGQPISQMPTFIGNPGTNAWLPILIGNANRKIAADVLFNSLFATKSSTDLNEGSKLFFTLARARAAIGNGYGLLYDVSTGLFRVDTTTLNTKYTDTLRIDNTLQVVNGVLGVKKSGISGTSKVIPDADYVIQTTDQYLVLPNPTATRTITLPAASTRQGLPITIVCAADANGDWILNGSFVLITAVGSSPFSEGFSNSGLASQQIIHLVPVNDNGTWRWFDVH